MKAWPVVLSATLGLPACKVADPNAPVPVPVPAPAPARVIATSDFRLPLPDGYDDATAELRASAPQLAAVLAVKKPTGGYQATIAVQKARIPGGSFADPATCARTGQGLMTGGTVAPGIQGTLKSTAIIDGPVGKACQIHLVTPEGASLITELHEPGNTEATPKDVWLLTCNHEDGDQHAEAICRSTLAGFRFTR